MAKVSFAHISAEFDATFECVNRLVDNFQYDFGLECK